MCSLLLLSMHVGAFATSASPELPILQDKAPRRTVVTCISQSVSSNHSPKTPTYIPLAWYGGLGLATGIARGEGWAEG